MNVSSVAATLLYALGTVLSSINTDGWHVSYGEKCVTSSDVWGLIQRSSFELSGGAWLFLALMGVFAAFPPESKRLKTILSIPLTLLILSACLRWVGYRECMLTGEEIAEWIMHQSGFGLLSAAVVIRFWTQRDTQSSLSRTCVEP